VPDRQERAKVPLSRPGMEKQVTQSFVELQLGSEADQHDHRIQPEQKQQWREVLTDTALLVVTISQNARDRRSTT